MGQTTTAPAAATPLETATLRQWRHQNLAKSRSLPFVTWGQSNSENLYVTSDEWIIPLKLRANRSNNVRPASRRTSATPTSPPCSILDVRSFPPSHSTLSPLVATVSPACRKRN